MSEEESKKTQQGEEDGDDLIMDFGDKKKKKDKKDKKEKKEKKDKKEKGDDEEEGDDADKEKKDKKKKDKKEKKEKKDKKEKASDDGSGAEETKDEPKDNSGSKPKEDDVEEPELFDFGGDKKEKKDKKKKDKKAKKGLFDVSDEEGENQNEEKQKALPKGQQTKDRCNLNEVEGHEQFTYEFLLQRVSDIVNEKEGVDTGPTGAFKLVEPKCGRTKTKSTWVNFEDQRVILDRKPQHVLDFYLSELGCAGNIGAQGEMVLVGGYQPKHFLRLIRKYIEEYVRCRDCRGYKSELVREEKTRLTYVKCFICSASRVVTTHHEGRFRGVKRGERRAARN